MDKGSQEIHSGYIVFEWELSRCLYECLNDCFFPSTRSCYIFDQSSWVPLRTLCTSSTVSPLVPPEKTLTTRNVIAHPS